MILRYLFITLLSSIIMAFTTILVALLNTVVGQAVLAVIAAWVASTVFGINIEDIPSSVWENPLAILDYL